MNHDIDAMLKNLNCRDKEIDAMYYKIAVNLNLSESAFWILYMLTSAGQECSQQEISQKLSISRQTVNSAICSLIQRGYIFLERSSISTRRKNIRMTDKGEFFVRQYIIPLQDAEYRAFLKMKESDQERYVALTQIFTMNLQAEMEKYLGLCKERKSDD